MVAPFNRGYVTLPEKAPRPGYPREYQREVDPNSLDLTPGLPTPGMPAPIPNLEEWGPHNNWMFGPGANPSRDMRTGTQEVVAPQINPFAGIQQVGDVVQFPSQRVQRNAAELQRMLYPTYFDKLAGRKAVKLPFTPGPVLSINPFLRPR